jgi:hypothetical protein
MLESRAPLKEGLFMKIRIKYIVAGIVVSALAVGCTNGTAEITTSGTSTSSVSATAQEGRLIDAPVQGVEYKTATQSGITDANGMYKYVAGEQVTFSIGKTSLGTVTAAIYVTPENFSTSGTGLSDQSVKNILRFLQTVDADGVPENGIEIKQAVRDLLAGTTINFNQTSANFDSDNLVKATIQVSRSAAVALVSEATALAQYLSYRYSGSFVDNYGGKHFLTPTSWQLKDTWTNQTDTVNKINGLAGYFIIQKSAADAYNASKFQKVIFIANADGSFYTCTISPFNSADAATAEAITDTTTKTNPEASGCSGFAWTKMVPVKNPIAGSWKDPYGGKHTIAYTSWTVDFGTPATDVIHRYNVIDSYFIIQKPANDAYNPAKYQKIILTESSGSWYFCTLSPFNSATADTAAAITDSTTKTSPATTGCSGFAWTALSP